MATDHLAHLDADTARLLDVLRTASVTSAVEQCPGWDLDALTRHLGTVHRWATAIVRTGDKQPQQTPDVDDRGFVPWLADGVADLQQVLVATDPQAPCWTLAGPGTAGFWRRRMALETAVHRWDAEHALGDPGPVDPGLAADGVAEVVEVMLPRQVHLDRIAPLTSAMRLVATDREAKWVVGSGNAVATVTGSSEALLLLLWRRTTRRDPRLTCEGDLAALDVLLATALTP